MRGRTILRKVSVIVSVMILPASAQSVRFVDADAIGAGNGTTWTDAYDDLQDALTIAASGDQIWVAAGTYTPDDAGGDPNATFQLKSGVALFGGFVGHETVRENRNPSLNKTILSGDLNNNDGPDFSNTQDNSFHVVTGSGTDGSAVLDGFTVTGGYADGGNDDNRGGGMFTARGSPTVRRCVFVANWSGFDGGGMYNVDLSEPHVTDCLFMDNVTDRGGGMFNRSGSDTHLVRCRFLGNEGRRCGGGMFNENSGPDVMDCVFARNVTDPVIGDSRGGAIYYRGGSSELANCTFAWNVANQRGGAIYLTNSSTVGMSNCVVWGNSAGVGPQLAIRSSSELTVEYCDVQDGQSQVHVNASTLNWLGGNIGVPPAFVDDDDLRLSSESPCIDVGDPGIMFGCNDIDLDHYPRVLCDRIDMGAYEFGAGDFDCDRAIDLGDFASWEPCLNNPNDVGCEAFHFDRRCNMDLINFGRFQVVFGGR